MVLKKFFIMSMLMTVCSGLLPLTVWGQYYDYHRDESPAVSWNGKVLFDARMMGAGGISFMASDAFAASINPALIPDEKGFHMGTSFVMLRHEAFQFRGINEGIITDPGNHAEQNYRLSGFALSYAFKGLRFAAGWYTANLLELPSVDYDFDTWGYRADYPGVENTFFAAAAFSLGRSVNVGLKLDYISAKRDADITETWKTYPVTMLHRETHVMNCLVPSIGMTIDVSPKWRVGGVFVYPLKGTADRTLDRIFESDFERIEITAPGSSDDFHRPTRFYLGAAFTPVGGSDDPGNKRLTIAAEVLYMFWSDYEYIFFSETMPRDMRNTAVLALGMEYGIFHTKRDYFFRVGYRLDPQPVKEPLTTLRWLTGGFGFRWGKVSADFGLFYCFGSAEGISQNHLAVNSTLQVAF
jgi:hypothetical protein